MEIQGNALFNKTLKTLANKAGIDKHVSFHSYKHTFATLSISSGIQAEVVKEILGHKDFRTTQIYAKLIDAKKDESHGQAQQPSLSAQNALLVSLIFLYL